MYLFTTIGGYNIMVMEYLGKNLQELFEINKMFSLKTVCMVGLQIVYNFY
jgi:hypothetical protein